jgi:ATPase subunit of ABC transporter with duplicated ATPase domains
MKKVNDMKEVKITVAGQVNTGKSTILCIIKNDLKEKGFDVQFEGNLDFPSEASFDKHFDPRLKKPEVLEYIASHVKVDIKEVQLQRQPL